MDIVTKRHVSLSPVFISPHVMLKNVSQITFLGISFTNDLKWNTHINNVVSKASRRLFVLYNLVRASCHPSLLMKVYYACLRSIMLYGYPAFCNMPVYLQKKLLAVERRAARIMRSRPDMNVLGAGDVVCRRLFSAIESHTDHPLRVMFTRRNPTPRNPKTLAVPSGKTKRFTSSFIRYARF